MFIVNHTTKHTDSVGNVTHKDNYQLCDTLDEAKEKVQQIIKLNDDLYCYAISSVIEASEPHWIEGAEK